MVQHYDTTLEDSQCPYSLIGVIVLFYVQFHFHIYIYQLENNKFFKNMITDITGKKMNWKKIEYTKSAPNSLFIKDDFDQEDFCTVRVICTTSRETATEKTIDLQPEQRYERKLLISEKKEKSTRTVQNWHHT